MFTKAEKRFVIFNLITIVSLFLLILAGGIVRSSGSGMGCPDWPKCFDQYIPPTNVEELSEDYKEKFVIERLEKNERFAKLLDKTGYSELAEKVRKDESIKVPEEFNPFNTYTEYINRLIGALTGVFLLLTFVFSLVAYKRRKRIFWLSLINLFLVVFQAWLGSIVVSTNLLAWVITIHMLVAILILAIAIYTYHDFKFLTKPVIEKERKVLFWTGLLTVISILVSINQIIIGTEVRETIDMVKSKLPELGRGEWLNEVGVVFLNHREWAIAVVLLNSLLFVLLKLKFKEDNFKTLGLALILLLAAQMITGLSLSYLNLAPWAQATHVLFATLLFSIQFYILLNLKRLKSISVVKS